MNKALLLTGFLAISAWAAMEESHFPGGRGTVDDKSGMAFSYPFPGLNRERVREFAVGNSFFRSAWVEAPASAEARDGLGPTFNAVACASCHFQDGRGAGFDEAGKIHLSLLFRLGVGREGHPHPAYGDQLNPFGISGVPGEGSVAAEFEEISGIYPDGTKYSLRKPIYRLENLRFGPAGRDTGLSPRVAPHLVGLGLLEAIPESEILANQERGALLGVGGKAAFVKDIATGELQLGRFGWKAEQPSLRQQNAAAFLGDMGLTTSLFRKQNCPAGQEECMRAISGGEPEVDDSVLNRVTVYTQLLAVPKRRDPESAQVRLGEEIFHQVNCQSCHRPSYVTGSHALPELAGQKIFPYTDLLLHEMGEGLRDTGPLKNASLWRTPPLWGIGLIPRVNRHSQLLHDGRARNVEEAILWHGGEAEEAKNSFTALPKEDREALITFVNSL